MLRKGDQGSDQPASEPGKAIELNSETDREALLTGDEKAQHFFDEIQRLKDDLHSLKQTEVLDTSFVGQRLEQASDQKTQEQAAAKEPQAKPEEPAAPAEAMPPAPARMEPEEAPEQVLKAAEAQAKTAPAATFEDQFRQQMETQMQAVQAEADERAKQKAARQAEKEAYRREKARRNAERREERRARAKRKQAERELRAEVKRKKRIADKSAELGGGIINLHDTTVSTEIQPVARFSWRDLLGIVPREQKRAAETEEELQALIEEQEQKTAEARATASQLSRVRASRYHNSALGRRMDAFKKACERHKGLLLTGMSMVLLVCVGAAGVINYCTAYEYSYNGHVLGYVKSKDEVLQITDMVQRALTEDKEMEVIIDAKDDISFRRVSTLDKDVVPDSSDEVLRRLTYMGDLNVKAYGIYVNGKKIGGVRSKEVAAEVLKQIEDRYSSDKKGTVIEKAEILETVEVQKSNTNLRNVYSADRMTDLLCTSGEKETVHTVIAGETLSDIAEAYGTTEEKLQLDNEGVDPTKLEVGSTLLIRQHAPLLTVRMTERRSYTQKIKFKTVTKKTDEMYEDEQIIEQEGKNGSEDITERTVSINGEQESLEVLKHVITKKPVKKIILQGTAERPPSVGDGVYIWPLAGGYTLTSHYGYRWGRLHAGIDLGTHVGNDVLAADGGIVIRAGYFGGYGYCVDIDHQNGDMTRYGHLSSILVSVGDEVYEGQHIAESGNTGASTGPHLHFEIHTNGQSHDPLQDLP
ncbi:MAG: peptidoglycan DD-metalloendopeptidase family protein [Firmicutes bacterium]|nr:peptidoglycan DD-metalloendopeptidase family protein [Bacillota bacterium]